MPKIMTNIFFFKFVEEFTCKIVIIIKFIIIIETYQSTDLVLDSDDLNKIGRTTFISNDSIPNNYV